MSHLSKYNVTAITYGDCKPWLLRGHYAKRMPSISYAFGLMQDLKTVGVCTFGSPVSNNVVIGVCGRDYKGKVLELNRLIIVNEKNLASFFVSRCLKLLPKPLVVISFADKSFGHTGYVYQALNFVYTGLTKKRTDRVFVDGTKQKHGRHMTSTDVSDIKERTVLVERPRKHRYVYFLGNKRQKKKMLNDLKYPIYEYPKKDNREYKCDLSFINETLF